MYSILLPWINQHMAYKDIEDVLQSTSIIISGGAKVGKTTFLSYLLQSLFKTKAIIFTTQEKYLFDRKINALSSQFKQFSNLQDLIRAFYIKEDWHNLKQKYGYAFFITELENIIANSEEKLIVMHRIGEYFEFQDRYEIENVYRSLIKIAIKYDKKIIFLANSKNENFEYIKNIADEFSDVSVTINSNNHGHRTINIKNLLNNQEYPVMNFKIHEKNFLLDYEHLSKKDEKNSIKNVLIAELDSMHDDTKEICEYLFNQPQSFNVKNANSLQTLLQEIFIIPDIIIIFMKRTQENLETTKSIKKQLPNSNIVAILDQPFIRSEDKREAYMHGIDELFSNDIILDNLILSLEKASKDTFYKKRLDTINDYTNVIENIKDFRKLANTCIDNSIFFTAFVLESKGMKKKVETSGRKHDYIYQKGEKLYYLAVNTSLKHSENIIENFKRQDLVFNVICECVATKKISVDECLV